jgi:hypothetical protein
MNPAVRATSTKSHQGRFNAQHTAAQKRTLAERRHPIPADSLPAPKVVEAVAAGQTVYLVEGEKDVHTLESIGLVATTAPMGADNFHKVDIFPLINANIIAIRDQDEGGQKWAQQVWDNSTATPAASHSKNRQSAKTYQTTSPQATQSKRY